MYALLFKEKKTIYVVYNYSAELIDSLPGYNIKIDILAFIFNYLHEQHQNIAH